MGSLSWADVLVGREGRNWRTVPQQRNVLVVVHTVTAATRLLDVLDIWAGDYRVQTAFTCTGTSAFTAGAVDFLRGHGIIPIPWEEAARFEFDLAIAASYGGPLHTLRAPLIVLPHGIGYNKFSPGNQGTSQSLAFPSLRYCMTVASCHPWRFFPITSSESGCANIARRP